MYVCMYVCMFHILFCVYTPMSVYIYVEAPDSGDLRPSAKAALWKPARLATGQVGPKPNSRQRVRGFMLLKTRSDEANHGGLMLC